MNKIVRANQDFKDIYTGKIHKYGEEFEVTEERLKEIQSINPELVSVIGEVKEPKITDEVKEPKITDEVEEPKITDEVKEPRTTDEVKEPRTTDEVKEPKTTKKRTK